jgi:replication-associated recombination protein RarA
MSVISEKYRPHSLDQVIGQELAVARLELIRRKFGWEGQCLFLSGPSGCGKTTLARIVAESVASPIAIDEVDAQDVSMDTLRDWERRCGFRPMGKGIWAYVINECHGLSSKVVSRLQTVLEQEQVCKNSTWIFTTTARGQKQLFDRAFDAFPFLSRAITIELDNGEETLLAFANRVREIALGEGLDGKPLENYYNLAVETECNFRLMLQRVASGDMLL